MVICDSRTPGDVATEMVYARNVRQQADMEQARVVVDKWEDANLARLALAANPGYETVEVKDDEEEVE